MLRQPAAMRGSLPTYPVPRSALEVYLMNVRAGRPVVVVYYRGDRSRFCRLWVRRWLDVPALERRLALTGAALLFVSAQSQGKAYSVAEQYGVKPGLLDDAVYFMGDPVHALAAHLSQADLLHPVVTNPDGHRAHGWVYDFGMMQPAVLAVVAADPVFVSERAPGARIVAGSAHPPHHPSRPGSAQPADQAEPRAAGEWKELSLFSWAMRPSFRNGGGKLERPDPWEVWDYVERRLDRICLSAEARRAALSGAAGLSAVPERQAAGVYGTRRGKEEDISKGGKMNPVHALSPESKDMSPASLPAGLAADAGAVLDPIPPLEHGSLENKNGANLSYTEEDVVGFVPAPVGGAGDGARPTDVARQCPSEDGWPVEDFGDCKPFRNRAEGLPLKTDSLASTAVEDGPMSTEAEEFNASVLAEDAEGYGHFGPGQEYDEKGTVASHELLCFSNARGESLSAGEEKVNGLLDEQAPTVENFQSTEMEYIDTSPLGSVARMGELFETAARSGADEFRSSSGMKATDRSTQSRSLISESSAEQLFSDLGCGRSIRASANGTKLYSEDVGDGSQFEAVRYRKSTVGNKGEAYREPKLTSADVLRSGARDHEPSGHLPIDVRNCVATVSDAETLRNAESPLIEVSTFEERVPRNTSLPATHVVEATGEHELRATNAAGEDMCHLSDVEEPSSDAIAQSEMSEHVSTIHDEYEEALFETYDEYSPIAMDTATHDGTPVASARSTSSEATDTPVRFPHVFASAGTVSKEEQCHGRVVKEHVMRPSKSAQGTDAMFVGDVSTLSSVHPVSPTALAPNTADDTPLVDDTPSAADASLVTCQTILGRRAVGSLPPRASDEKSQDESRIHSLHGEAAQESLRPESTNDGVPNSSKLLSHVVSAERRHAGADQEVCTQPWSSVQSAAGRSNTTSELQAKAQPEKPLVKEALVTLHVERSIAARAVSNEVDTGDVVEADIVVAALREAQERSESRVPCSGDHAVSVPRDVSMLSTGVGNLVNEILSRQSLSDGDSDVDYAASTASPAAASGRKTSPALDRDTSTLFSRSCASPVRRPLRSLQLSRITESSVSSGSGRAGGSSGSGRAGGSSGDGGLQRDNGARESDRIAGNHIGSRPGRDSGLAPMRRRGAGAGVSRQFSLPHRLTHSVRRGRVRMERGGSDGDAVADAAAAAAAVRERMQGRVETDGEEVEFEDEDAASSTVGGESGSALRRFRTLGIRHRIGRKSQSVEAPLTASAGLELADVVQRASVDERPRDVKRLGLWWRGNRVPTTFSAQRNVSGFEDTKMPRGASKVYRANTISRRTIRVFGWKRGAEPSPNPRPESVSSSTTGVLRWRSRFSRTRTGIS